MSRATLNRSTVVSLSLVAAVACGGSSRVEGPENALVDAAPVADAGERGDATPADLDAAAPVDSSAPRDTAPVSRPLRFVAIGDTGTGSADQFKVAAAIKAKCAASGCDFVQLLGDNFYDSGVSSATDPQFATKFEQPYAGIDVPFWVVLGNHDYGANGAGTDITKPDNQIAYAATSSKFRLPARYWHRVEGEAEFFGLDTNAQMFNQAGEQKTAVAQWIAASRSKWKIAFGHHPYLSNGPHGNAGRYDGVPFVPIANGAGVKSFMDSTICGAVDIYLSGHDHSRQYLQEPCGATTSLVVSGAGAKVTTLSGTNAIRFQAATIGFVYVTLDARTLTIEFIDADGRSEYTRTLSK